LDPRLAGPRAAWEAKPALRAVYQDTYARIAAALVPGPTLEVGGGSGGLARRLPGVIATDVLPGPWLDAVADAHALPFAPGAFANLVMVDVLHHLAAPLAFFREAARVLAPGGRLVMVEPAITPASRVAFALGHPEPVDARADPLAEASVGRRDPFAANQAIPTLLLTRDRERLAALVPDLVLREARRFALLAYPLSGGYRSWSLVPARFVPALLRLEGALAPLLGPLMAFRWFASFERR
jgi:SAM-dependent methyltransferase